MQVITNAQKAKLHVAKSQLRLTDDQYRAVLLDQGGVESSIDLDNAGYDKVIKRFVELGFINTTPKRWSRSRPSEPVTPDQQKLIEELYGQLGWDATARRAGFSKRCCGKPWPQSRADANKVIEGLKAILQREQKESQG